MVQAIGANGEADSPRNARTAKTIQSPPAMTESTTSALRVITKAGMSTPSDRRARVSAAAPRIRGTKLAWASGRSQGLPLRALRSRSGALPVFIAHSFEIQGQELGQRRRRQWPVTARVQGLCDQDAAVGFQYQEVRVAKELADDCVARHKVLSVGSLARRWCALPPSRVPECGGPIGRSRCLGTAMPRDLIARVSSSPGKSGWAAQAPETSSREAPGSTLLASRNGFDPTPTPSRGSVQLR